MSGLDLGKKVGPLPLGAWMVAAAGGLFIAFRARGEGSSEPAASVNDSLPTGGGYGAQVGSWDGAPVVLSPIIRVPAPKVTINNKIPEPTTTPTPKPKPPAKPPRVPVKTKPKPPAKPKPKPKPKPAKKHTPAPARRTHTVRKGDTLWDLAQHYYRNPLRWPRIYSANKAAIESAARHHGRKSSGGGHWIYPGTSLVIP